MMNFLPSLLMVACLSAAVSGYTVRVAAPACDTAHEGDFYPDPQDCHKYYRCTDEISVLMDCSTDFLVWNTKLNTCDYPFRTDTSHCQLEATDSLMAEVLNADSLTDKLEPSTTKVWTTKPTTKVWTTSPTPTTTPTPTTSKTTTLPTNTTTAHPTTTNTPAWTGPPRPTCTKADDGKFLPEPSDCNKYWRCSNKLAYFEMCPLTLVWNEKLGYCDYKDHTDTSHCTLKLSAAPRDAPTCTTPHEGDFYPYPQDCHKYYRCTDDISILMDCKGVLVWNNILDTCDYPNRTDTSHCKMSNPDTKTLTLTSLV